MSEPTNSASGVEPAADTLFADLENTQPPYDPEYDAHIPPEDTSAPEEYPFAHESFMPEFNPEAVNAQTVTAHEDALGEFMPPAYRVGGYGSEHNPEDPYGERTYSLSTIDPATLIDGLKRPAARSCFTCRFAPADRRRSRVWQNPRADAPHRPSARNRAGDSRADSRHHLHKQGCGGNA